jgi:hypothetical protein
MDLFHIELNRGNNHNMLYHFILIFSLGLKEFLAACPIILLIFFPRGFWRRFNQDDEYLYNQIGDKGDVKNNYPQIIKG